jgi:hypothetical protein
MGLHHAFDVGGVRQRSVYPQLGYPGVVHAEVQKAIRQQVDARLVGCELGECPVVLRPRGHVGAFHHREVENMPRSVSSRRCRSGSTKSTLPGRLAAVGCSAK